MTRKTCRGIGWSWVSSDESGAGGKEYIWELTLGARVCRTSAGSPE